MLNGFNQNILSILIQGLVFLIAITVHECSHGYAAYLMGDRTAKSMGRLTLNPLKHIDIVGLLLLLTFGFGWAKPVPIDMRNFENPKRGMALSALAGPVSNILLAFISALGLVLFNPSNYYLQTIILLMFQINVMLAVLNLLPIPPLDGSKIVFAILPDNLYYKLMQIERFGTFILIILISTGVLNPILNVGIQNMQNAIVHTIQLLPI